MHTYISSPFTFIQQTTQVLDSAFVTAVTMWRFVGEYYPGQTSSSRHSYPLYLITYLLHATESFFRSWPFLTTKKLPAFYGAWSFITAFTSAHHPSLTQASLIQSIPPHPNSWRSIPILSSHLWPCLPSGLFPSGFPTKTLYMSLLSHVHATCPTHLNHLDSINWTELGEKYTPLSSSLCSFLHSLVTSSLFGPNTLLNTFFSNTLSPQ